MILYNISVNKERNGTVESTSIFKCIPRIRRPSLKSKLEKARSSCPSQIFSAVQIMPSRAALRRREKCMDIRGCGARGKRMKDGGEGDEDLSKLPSGRASRVMRCREFGDKEH